MGTLRSIHDWSGREVGGTILGQAAVQEDGSYLWDGAVPDGTIDDVGNIVTSTLGQLVEPTLAPADPPVTAAEKDAGVVRLAVVDDTLVAYDGRDKVLDLGKIEIQYETVTPVFAEAEITPDVKPN